MAELPDSAREVLEHGTLCYLAAPSPLGPHVTPVVFVLERGRVWGTTGRRTTKARRWRSLPVAGGLVRLDDRAVAFRGTVSLYDALHPSTWPASILRAPVLTLASLRFSRKNARFFAGYARDVTRVPLAWTPPARVIFSVNLDDGAVLERGRVSDRWGSWRDAEPRPAPRPPRGAEDRPVTARLDEQRIPEDLRALVGAGGDGSLALDGRRGPVVLPVTWTRRNDGFLAVVDRAALALAEAQPRTRAGLVVDRSSNWRAAEMSGVLLRGDALATPEARAESPASRPGADPHPDPVGIEVRPDSAVWWRGWASGSVSRS